MLRRLRWLVCRARRWPSRREGPCLPASWRAALVPGDGRCGDVDHDGRFDVRRIEPMRLESLGFAPKDEGLALRRVRRHRDDRTVAGQLHRRSLVDQPDRRQRHAAIRRSGDAGHREHRWTACARRSATPTAAAASSSRCGWSAPTSHRCHVSSKLAYWSSSGTMVSAGADGRLKTQRETPASR
jgi:hypothetical protein